MFDLNEIYYDLQKKIMYYACIVILYGLIIYGIRKTNQFYGINENSDLIDCIYYTSIVFTGSGYGEIYPQTQLGKIIILSLSIIKLIIIVLPFERFPPESFKFSGNEISIKDVEEVAEEIKLLNINFDAEIEINEDDD